MISLHLLLQRIHSVFLLFCLFNTSVTMANRFENASTELKTALQAKGVAYQPRTKHILANGQPEFINRLILEDSPYLLQHAHNPVNWYAWGDAAFTAAKQENKAIFLSIGYSTCFWCHVMERESFENKEIADFLNKHFISIKVDRERRPDVDAIYMAAVTLITGSGGWPMSSFLTPSGKTFIGGAYFPPEKFKNLIHKINTLWQQQPQLLIKQADQVALKVEKQFTSQQQAKRVNSSLLTQTTDELLYQHDNLNGGFGFQPKFPHETWLLYLLKSGLRFDNTTATKAVEISLLKMAQGGLYDHIGGGFHRYSTDHQWKIPHFEKMLYNQAQLSQVYLLAYQMTANKLYAQTARETLDYVLQDLITDEGVFYSATDAGNQDQEGRHFLWTKKQINQSLSPKLAELAIHLYGITEQGNFAGKNVLFLQQSLAKYAQQNDLDLAKLEFDIQLIKSKLRRIRQQRIPPFTDRKILTTWNAMMINSLAIGSDALGEEKYLNAAKKAANFIWSKLDLKTEQLWRVYLEGRSSIPANQEDYAYYAEALVKIYDVTGDKQWLDKAQFIADRMLTLFWDSKQGGLFMNVAHKTDRLILRPKAIKDNEIAAGNAVAFRVFNQLATRVNNPVYAEKANQLLASFSTQLFDSPLDYGYLLLAATDFLYGEQDSVQYAAKGAVSVRAYSNVKEKKTNLELEITIDPNWHINAHQPIQPYLIPTSIHLSKKTKHWKLGVIDYPKPIKKQLSFQRETLALYEGKIKLTVPIDKISEGNHLLKIIIKLQACNDKICLPPEELELQVPL